jgi:hypothetical protein
MMPNKYAACFLNKATISKPAAEFYINKQIKYGYWLHLHCMNIQILRYVPSRAFLEY